MKHGEKSGNKGKLDFGVSFSKNIVQDGLSKGIIRLPLKAVRKNVSGLGVVWVEESGEYDLCSVTGPYRAQLREKNLRLEKWRKVTNITTKFAGGVTTK